jgi:uncharacterized BrkB/YihY/UPF0761 family membrane protein
MTAEPPPDAPDGIERPPGRLDTVRARAARIPGQLQSARGRHASVDATFDYVERDRRVAASVLAGGISFRLFFWLLPFALILGGVLGFASPDDAERTAEHVGLTGTAANAIADASAQANRGRWALLLIGAGTLLWTSSWSVVAFRRVHALIWNVPPPRRSRSPLVEALAFSGLIVALLAIPAGAARLRDVAPDVGLLIQLLAIGGFFALWLLISSLLPHGDAPVGALVPGALLVALTAQFVHLFAVLYVFIKIERAPSLYGGLGLAATLLFVLYVIGRIVVASAVLNAELWRRKQAGPDAEPPG